MEMNQWFMKNTEELLKLNNHVEQTLYDVIRMRKDELNYPETEINDIQYRFVDYDKEDWTDVAGIQIDVEFYDDEDTPYSMRVPFDYLTIPLTLITKMENRDREEREKQRKVRLQELHEREMKHKREMYEKLKIELGES